MQLEDLSKKLINIRITDMISSFMALLQACKHHKQYLISIASSCGSMVSLQLHFANQTDFNLSLLSRTISYMRKNKKHFLALSPQKKHGYILKWTKKNVEYVSYPCTMNSRFKIIKLCLKYNPSSY